MYTYLLMGSRPSYTDASGEERSEYKIGVEIDGKEYVIPTVWDGEQHTQDEAYERFIETGEHMLKVIEKMQNVLQKLEVLYMTTIQHTQNKNIKKKVAQQNLNTCI